MTKVNEFERLMADVAAGSEDAVFELAEIYTPYIVRSVRRWLSPQIRPKFDSQDVTQTLWASLLLRRGELLRLKTPGELIAFLAQAAKNKVAAKARFVHAQKRNITRETRLPEGTQRFQNDRVVSDPALCSREPTPSTLVSVRERWRTAISNASERDQQIVKLLLQRHTFIEIGSLLSIHEQTARRAVEKLVDTLAE